MEEGCDANSMLDAMRNRFWILDAGRWIKRRSGMRRSASGIQNPASSICHSPRCAFTLIELMVVIGILALIMATGIPAIYQMNKKEGMRQATESLIKVCGNARQRAIFSGTVTRVIFHPSEKRFEVSGGGGRPAAGNQRYDENGEVIIPTQAPPPTGDGITGTFGEDLVIEMLDVNLVECREFDSAEVRFFPNGTCDELTIILRSNKGEWRKISTELTTGIVTFTEQLQ